MWRICCQCGLRTDDEVCPDDGVATEQIRAHTEFPGRLQNGYMLRDQYRIEGLAGVGGMGVVYKAVHSITHQPVAIKVLWRDLATNPQEVRRFTREARAASILTHPNTVRVYDFGREERSDAIYMVMEFLVGRKLSDLLAETPVIAPTRAVHITAQICKALEEAHAKGIVHRDLKPDNIFLQDIAGEKDFVKVLDFGLAKFVTGNFERDNLTKTGYVVGSPEYMAPEQAIGSNVGPAADLYSVGIILYEILTGDLPFDAVSTAQVLRKHIMDRVPDMPEGIRSNIPSKLEAVVLRCLEKDPVDRPPSAEVLRIHLLQAQDRRRREPSQSVAALDGQVDTHEIVTGGAVSVEAPGAVAGAVLHPDGTGTDLSPRPPTPVSAAVGLSGSAGMPGSAGVPGSAGMPGSAGVFGSTGPSALPGLSGGALATDHGASINRPSTTPNGRALPANKGASRQSAGKGGGAGGFGADVFGADSPSSRQADDEAEAPVSGWMLVGIGTAAAGAVLIAALLLK